jgi:hypothetical protein
MARHPGFAARLFTAGEIVDQSRLTLPAWLRASDVTRISGLYEVPAPTEVVITKLDETMENFVADITISQIRAFSRRQPAQNPTRKGLVKCFKMGVGLIRTIGAHRS